MTFKFDNIIILNKHAEQLKASLYNLNNFINNNPDKPLYTKEIETLIKAIKDNKTIDQEKFPHLPRGQPQRYGEMLREYFMTIEHLHQFMSNALISITESLNESRNFDISFNYTYVMPILQLFKNYVDLNIFVNSIAGVDRVVTVYCYCYKVTQKKEEKLEPILKDFLSGRTGYTKLHSEMQQLQDRLFSFYNSIISCMSRILHAGSSYSWKELNINDNPQEMDSNKIFLKPEILVMINFKLLCDSLLYFSLICPAILNNNQQYTDTFLAILAHSSNIQLYGDLSVTAKTVLTSLSNVQKHKSTDPDRVMQKLQTKTKEIDPIRDFRQYKLSMIMNEYVSAAKFDVNVLLNKLFIIQAILGLINYEIQTELVMNSQRPSLISMISAACEIIILYARNKNLLQRFLIFNFREYDGPFLNSMIQSFTIPQTTYNRLATMVQAFMTIDIEEFDKGAKYDLTGMNLALLREMTAFNSLSKSRGVLHLSPLFTLISAIWYHVDLFTNIDYAFLDICQLHKLWPYTHMFIELTKWKPISDHRQSTDGKQSSDKQQLSDGKQLTEAEELRYLGLIGCFFELAHFTYADSVAARRIPGFAKKNDDYVVSLLKAELGTVLDLSKQLQSKYLRKLFDQTKCTTKANMTRTDLTLNPKKGDPIQTKFSQAESLIDIPIGFESTMHNRKLLESIQQRITAINSIINKCVEIGAISLSSSKYSLRDQIQNGIKQLFNTYFASIKFKDPFKAFTEIQIAKYLFQNLFQSAQLSYGSEFNQCLSEITKANITKSSESGVMKIEKEKGAFAEQFVSIFENFFDSVLSDSYYEETAQQFTAAKSGVKVQPQLLCSHLAIRTVYQILGEKGIDLMDVTAINAFVKTCDKLYSKIRDSKLLDQTQVFITAKADISWITQLLTPDQNDTQYVQIAALLVKLGAIQKFRSILRNALSLSKIDAESDSALIAALKKSKIMPFITNPAFPSFLGAALCSTYFSDLEYGTKSDAFKNNAHLVACGIEAVFAAARVQQGEKATFKPKEAMVTFLRTAYNAIFQGGKLIQAKNKKNKWSNSLLLIVLDHIVQNSYYLDYSHLETVVPYQTIRHVYRVILASENL